MAMLHKRKRSDSDFCSSPISSSCSSSNAMMMDASPRVLLDAHLNSRTFKRYRDCRPSDEEVHRKFYEWRAHHQLSTNSSSSVPAERTLGLLFSGQQRQQQQQQIPTPAEPSLYPQQQQPQESAPANSQQSLHRFWNISSEPSSATSSPSLECPSVPASCEDCGAGLSNGGDDAMEVDSFGAADTACGACGKHVCFSCSVSNLGEQKRCLQCAGRRVWVGGIGWTNASVSVC